jgi:hypothetical protein
MAIAPKSAAFAPEHLQANAKSPFNFLGSSGNPKVAPPPLKPTTLPQGVIFRNGAASLVQNGEQVVLRLSGWSFAKAQMTSALRALIARLAAGVTAALIAELAIILGCTAAITGFLFGFFPQNAGNSDPDFNGIRRALTLAGYDLNKHPELIEQLLSVDSKAFIATADRLAKDLNAGTKTKAQVQGILKSLYQKVILKPLPPIHTNADFGDVRKRKLAPHKKTNAEQPTAQSPYVSNADIGHQLGKVNSVTPTNVAKGEDIKDIAIKYGISVKTLKNARQSGETYEQTAQRLQGSHKEGETYDQTAERHTNKIDNLADKLEAILNNPHNTEQVRQDAAQLIRQMDQALVVAALNRFSKNQRFNLPEVVRMAIRYKFREAFN